MGSGREAQAGVRHRRQHRCIPMQPSRCTGTAAPAGWPAPQQQRGRTFLLFRICTRMTPGTGFMPSFCIALRLFFSLRLCLPRAPPSSPAAAAAAAAPCQEHQRASTKFPSCNHTVPVCSADCSASPASLTPHSFARRSIPAAAAARPTHRRRPGPARRRHRRC